MPTATAVRKKTDLGIMSGLLVFKPYTCTDQYFCMEGELDMAWRKW